MGDSLKMKISYLLRINIWTMNINEKCIKQINLYKEAKNWSDDLISTGASCIIMVKVREYA